MRIHMCMGIDESRRYDAIARVYAVFSVITERTDCGYLIINDAKALEAEAIRGEEDAQKSYEDMVKETNAAMDEANNDITNKAAAKGKAEGDKAEAEVELEATNSELELLANKNNDIHSSCDFMMKNFEVRHALRQRPRPHRGPRTTRRTRTLAARWAGPVRSSTTRRRRKRRRSAARRTRRRPKRTP